MLFVDNSVLVFLFLPDSTFYIYTNYNIVLYTDVVLLGILFVAYY